MSTACVKLSLSDVVNNKVLICSSDDDGCLMKWTNAFVETISSPHSLQSLDLVTPPPPYTHTKTENSGHNGFSSITALGPAERHSPALYNNKFKGIYIHNITSPDAGELKRPMSRTLAPLFPAHPRRCVSWGGASVVTNDWCITKQAA